MSTLTTPVDDLVVQLQARLDALGDGRDCQSDNEKALWYMDRSALASIISGLHNPDLDKPQRLLAEAEAERAAVLAKREAIMAELAVSPVSLPDQRSRDREHDRQTHLRRQLQRLLDGTLYRSPGVTYRRLADLDTQIVDLQQKIARLQAREQAYVTQAQAVLARSAR
jgi:hypothetical protein